VRRDRRGFIRTGDEIPTAALSDNERGRWEKAAWPFASPSSRARRAGLVEREQRGSWAYFRVCEQPLAALRELLV
jgi:hypothetical protein